MMEPQPEPCRGCMTPIPEGEQMCAECRYTEMAESESGVNLPPPPF